MTSDFNVSHIPFRFFCTRLVSNDLCNNLIIESSSNNIELNSNNKNSSFNNNNTIFNYGINLHGLDLSNIRSISAKTLNIDTLFLNNSQNNIEDYGSIENGYIRATTIGYNPNVSNDISGRSNAYFTYINVSGGDSSFNNSVYIKSLLSVNGSTTISNDLIVNGKSYVTLYNAINNYIVSASQQLVSATILTNDLIALNISISNELFVKNTSLINDLNISGELLNNVLKLPSIFTIDPSGHDNASGTLIVNGDLIVYGNRTIIASSNVDISDVAFSVATNLINNIDLSENSAGLDISNIASLKYNGTTWNFAGGQLSVENKNVYLDVSFIEFRGYVEASLNNLNNYFDLSLSQLKMHNDNSFNTIYSRSQIDASFMSITQSIVDISSLRSYFDNSFVNKTTYDASFRDLKTYLDVSYIAKGTPTNPDIIDVSLDFLRNKLDLSYVLNSTFEGSFNKLKQQIEISFASVTLTSLNTSSISVETINTKHSSNKRFNNILWNQLGIDISNGGPFNNNYNKIAVSNDGKVFAYSKLYSVLDPSQVEQAVTNWTLRTIPTNFSSGYNSAIAWSPQLQIFVVVGQGTSNTKTMYSYNGIDWFLGSMLTSLGGIHSNTVCWSPQRNLFVAIGGYERDNISDYKAMTSSDGINWTERITPTISRSSQWVSICWSPELSLFVAVADTGDYKIMTSPDGIIWTHILSSYNIARLTWVCWSAQLGIFVTINLFGSEVYTSKNGSSWTKYDFPQELISTYKQCICWSKELGLFVAVGSAGTYRIITSRNGTDWTPVYGDGGGGLFFVDWIPALNLFIALRRFANDTQSVLTSPDGLNWTPRNVPSSGGWLGCSWSSEQRILVAIASTVTGYSGPSKIMTSSVTTPFALEPKGRVYVYELSYNQPSYNWIQLGLSSEILVGVSNDDQFGWDIALSSDGRVVAGSSIVSDASGINCGQVRLFELSNNTIWRQKGSVINGPRPSSESGYSISLAGNGNSIAIGAWRDNSNGTNAGAVRVYDFSANINDWRQKGQTIAGISGSYEGYSTALSLDGLTLACGSIETLETSGGIITTNGPYRIHSFTTVSSSSIFKPTFTGPVEVLIVGGGGGGGRYIGGGGGGGGVIYMPAVNVTAGRSYTVAVGGGGPSNTSGSSSSVFGAIAAGGGGSGSFWNGSGIAGGSGGGAAATEIGMVFNLGGNNTGNSLGSNDGIANNGFIYGNRGGNITVLRSGDPTRAAGGGGGGGPALDTPGNLIGDVDGIAGNTGQNGAGSGGIGIVNAILGPSYYWGGGGGGGAYTNQIGGWGGLGGGGGGSGRQSFGSGPGGGIALNNGAYGIGGAQGGAGGANTGGGGGGGTYGYDGGTGGSGIVIIRYLQQCAKTFVWSGINWVNKGTIQGPQYIGTGIKLSANGNTIVASMPVTKTINFIDSSATTGWTYSAWTNDVSIRLEKHYLNYTVAANLGGSMAVATTVNGVPFQAGVPFQTSAYRGTNFLIEGSNMGVADSTNNNISGASRDLANDFIYGSNVYTVTLYNLIPGKKYQTTFFSLAWDGGGSTARNQTFSTSSGVSILINPNIYDLNNGIVIKNTFIANNTGTQVFTITRINNGITFHFYALTNVLLDIKISEELRGGTFVYSYQGGTTWTQLGQAIQGISGGNEFGSSVAISNDGTIVSVGTNDISSNRGYVNVYKYVNNYWTQISNTLNGKVLSFKAGIHALSGDGTTLFQSNNNYYTVYGINKTLTLNSPITSISGNLIVMGAISVNSLDISTNHFYSSNGYSYKMFGSDISSTVMKEYYSDVTSTRHLKVQIFGNGDIRNRNNSYKALSDSRLKENILTSGPKLEDLLKVRVVDYKLKGSDPSKYIGVLAQELEDVFPNLVTELEPSPKDIEDGNTIKYKAVNYSSFDAILIKSLQEQNAMLKNIEKRIIALENM